MFHATGMDELTRAIETCRAPALWDKLKGRKHSKKRNCGAYGRIRRRPAKHRVNEAKKDSGGVGAGARRYTEQRDWVWKMLH